MPTTFKDRLSLIKASLDGIFASARPDEKTEVIKELRDYLSLQNSTVNRLAYDTKRSPGDSTQPH